MDTQEITIRVDANVAKAYAAASGQEGKDDSDEVSTRVG